jgi:flagellar biosynthesis chaperone FliJ
MDNRSEKSLSAAERVRDLAVDEAKRALSDSVYVCKAARRGVELLNARITAADTHQSQVLSSTPLDIESLLMVRRFRGWLGQELTAAQRTFEAAERAEIDARLALHTCVRARDAVRRLRERRRLEALASHARRAQHILDEQGALRAIAARPIVSFQSGGHHGD